MLDKEIERLHFLGTFQKIPVDNRKRMSIPLDLIVVLELKQDLVKSLKHRQNPKIPYSDILRDQNIYCYISQKPIDGELTVYPEIAFLTGRISYPDKYVKRILDHYDEEHAHYRLTLTSKLYSRKEVDIGTRGDRFTIKLHS